MDANGYIDKLERVPALFWLGGEIYMDEFVMNDFIICSKWGHA